MSYLSSAFPLDPDHSAVWTTADWSLVDGISFTGDFWGAPSKA